MPPRKKAPKKSPAKKVPKKAPKKVPKKMPKKAQKKVAKKSAKAAGKNDKKKAPTRAKSRKKTKTLEPYTRPSVEELDYEEASEKADRFFPKSVVTRGLLQKYLSDISKVDLLTPQEELDLAVRIQAGDPEALDAMVQANLRFVVAVVKRYAYAGIPIEDLINEGNLGLIEAAKRFDPERKVRFVTYAIWWIRQAAFHALAEHRKPVKLPPQQVIQLRKMKKSAERLRQQHGREPEARELAEDLGLSESDLTALQAFDTSEVSLDETITADGDTTKLDLLEQHLIPGPEESFIQKTVTAQVHEMLNRLSEREREVISLRFGLDGEDPMTLDSVGKKLKLSRERVRQVQAQAIRKLRYSQLGRELRGYLN